MSNGTSDPSTLTVGHLYAAVNRAEHWLQTVKVALAGLPVDHKIELDENSEAAKALQELQPKFLDDC